METGGRTGKSIKNIKYSLISQIVSLVLSFASRSVFVNVFGAEYLGINGLFADILNLLSLADLGLGTAMVYSFYKPLAEDDQEKMAALTTFYKKVYLIISITVTVVGLAIIPVLPFLVNTEMDIAQVRLYYVLSLAGVVISYICVHRTSILSANQEGHIIAKTSMIINVLQVSSQICVSLLLKNYIVYLLVGLFFALLNNVIASYLAGKKYPFIKKKAQLSKEEKRGIMSNVGSAFIYKVSGVLLNATDNILISVIAGTVMVGFYSSYLLIQTKMMLFYTLIYGAITASIGNLIAKETAQKKHDVFQCLQSIGFIASSILVPCFVVLIGDFIGIWLGNDYRLPASVPVIMGLNIYLACVLQPLWSYRDATGLYGKTKWAMIICAVVNLVLSWVLGQFMGLCGIVLASALSRLLTYVWYEPMVLYKSCFERSAKGYYINIVLNFILVAGVSFLLLWLGNYFVIDSLWKWIVKAICALIICILAAFLFYYKTDGMRMIFDRIKGLFKKKEKKDNE